MDMAKKRAEREARMQKKRELIRAEQQAAGAEVDQSATTEETTDTAAQSDSKQ